MKIGLMALSGVRVQNQQLVELGVTLPQFVSRGKVIAQLPSLALLILAALTPDDIGIDYVEVPDVDKVTALDIGGVHASAVPEEAGEHADSVAIGEAEALWPAVIDDLRAGSLQPVYREENPPATDLSMSLIPRYDLLDPVQYNRITVQTSRGCPHECEFCAGSKLFGKGFRQKPVNLVLRELETIIERWPQPFIEFADDNTFVDRKWAKELLTAIRPLGIRWFTETDISVAEDQELLKLMYHSGCYQLLIGLESPNKESLENIDQHNWKQGRQPGYAEAIERIQANGISVNGCFIVGLDGDRAGIFEEIRNFISETQLLEAQVTVLTPFPGTPLYRRLARENRLLGARRWEHCTMFDLCFTPKRMTAEELESGLAWLYGEIYNERQFLRRKRHYMDIIKKLPRRTQ